MFLLTVTVLCVMLLHIVTFLYVVTIQSVYVSVNRNSNNFLLFFYFEEKNQIHPCVVKNHYFHYDIEDFYVNDALGIGAPPKAYRLRYEAIAEVRKARRRAYSRT